MDRKLSAEDVLESSPVVANCRMNRKRGVVGRNSYAAELGLDPLKFLGGRSVAWLDLCCGTGKALVQAALNFQKSGQVDRVAIHGVDLIEMFDPVPPDCSGIILEDASLHDWTAAAEYDLITCVHGLHYVGDKLGLIARAAAWLKPDGLFLGHLDLNNVKLTTGRWLGGQLGKQFRRAGFDYHRRRRLLSCRGK